MADTWNRHSVEAPRAARDGSGHLSEYPSVQRLVSLARGSLAIPEHPIVTLTRALVRVP